MSSVSSADYAFLKSLNSDNIDNLSFFGREAQTGLATFSRTVSDLVNRGEGDRFEDLVEKIESFEGFNPGAKKDGGFLSKVFGRGKRKRSSKSGPESYDELIKTINDLKLCLQLQQARLIKDNFILDEMAAMVERSGADLEELIGAGERWLDDHRGRSGEEDLVLRVEKRLEDLRISRMISLQSLEQTRLMRENNNSLIEKSVSAVTNVIPLWENRAAIMKSLEKMETENMRLTDMLTDLSATKETDRKIKEKINELIKTEV